MDLATPIQNLSGIGPVFQKKLKKLGIKTVDDLLFHFPHRYEDFSNVKKISQLKINENCCIGGKILGIETSRTWKKGLSLTKAVAQDDTGAIEAVWFNQPYLTKVLKQGDLVYLAGKTTLGKHGFYLSNPAYEKSSDCAPRGSAHLTHMGRIVPVYPETEGLSSRWLRNIIQPILVNLKNDLRDPLPEKIIREQNLLPIKEAVWQIHFPDSLALAERAKERFSFEELFFIELWVLRERMKLAEEKAPPIPINIELVKRLVESLPFKLTDAQRKSAWAILKDLEKPRPMNRLLEGEAGSGKTVVATLAALNAIKAGCQVAFMAPTEILAKQHFKTIWEIVKNFKLNIGLLTGKEDKFYSKKLKNDWIEISRQKLLEKTLSGEINLLIGTHALIQGEVKFGNLALVIIDEQHRFGVEQRARLVRGPTSNIPHFLSMTATPIPRTLAMTIYGDLDLSVIDQLPKGRKKIITAIVPPSERKKTYDFIRKEVKNERQAFVICPRIEEEGKLEIRSVKAEYEKLSKQIFPDLRVAMLHGKMTGSEKERTMRDFRNEKTDVLVSTSVVEVGVDIPNATVMAIEGADRFGLAQLHQFRGRVGRSEHQSYCFLFADAAGIAYNRRLRALVHCQNGFELAEKDLAIRGPGDFTGARQWGIPDLVMNSLGNISLLEKTKEYAREILAKDPRLKAYPLLKERLGQFREKVHLE